MKLQIDKSAILSYIREDHLENRVEIVSIDKNIVNIQFIDEDIKGLKAIIIYINNFSLPQFYIESRFKSLDNRFMFHSYREDTPKFGGFSLMCIGNHKDMIIQHFNPNQLIVKVIARFFGNFIDISYEDSKKNLYYESAQYIRNNIKNKVKVFIYDDYFQTGYGYLNQERKQLIIKKSKELNLGNGYDRYTVYCLKINGQKVKNKIFNLFQLRNNHYDLLMILLTNCVSSNLRKQYDIIKNNSKDFIILIDTLDDFNSLTFLFKVLTIGKKIKEDNIIKYIIKNKEKINVEMIAVSGNDLIIDERKESLINRTMGEDRIGKKIITLVGVGAVGSYISEQLSTMFFGKINLIDGDYLTVNNIFRFYGGKITDGEQYIDKVKVINDNINEKNKYLEVFAYNHNFFNLDYDKIKEIIDETDLFILSLDDLNNTFEIEKILKMNKKSYIITWLELNGIGMHAVYINANSKMTYKSLFNLETGYNKYNFIKHQTTIIKRHFDGCGGTFIQHGAVAAINVSSLVSELVNMHFIYKDFKNILIQQKALHIPMEYKQYLSSWYYSTEDEIITMTKIKEGKDTVLKKYLIEDNTYLLVKKDLLNEIHSFYTMNNEVGGMLLISKLKDTNNYKLADFTIPQPKDKMTLHSYTRSEQHIKIAKAIKKRSSGKIVYFGGWHSHHSSLLNSEKDLSTWKEVARLNPKKKYVFFLIINKIDHLFYAIRTNDLKKIILREEEW